MKKTKNNEIDVVSGEIYLSGSYFFKHIQNHYPVESQPQCATASIAIKSDKFSGDISRIVLDFIYTGQVAGTSEYELTKPPIIIDFQDYDQIVYKAIRIPVPISQIAAWTFLLKNVPGESYYISYEVGPARSYAFLTPVANTLHTIGQS